MKNNYFEIFGPAATKPDYFITHSFKGYQVGNYPTNSQKIIEAINFTINKILPRVVVCVITPFLLGNFLTLLGQIIAIPLLLVLILHIYPPSINTVYLIHMFDGIEDTYNKLLFYSKDISEGFCVYKRSFVIKNKSNLGMIRLLKSLSNFIELKDYQKNLQAESKKEFNKQYQKIVNNI